MAANDPKLPWWAQPFFPELDAEGTDFRDYTPTPKPNAFDLDRLFFAEHLQLLRFGGLRAYEALVLQQLEPYTPRLVLPRGLSGYNSSDSSENEEDTNEAYENDDDAYIIDDKKGGSSLFNIYKPSNPTLASWVERDFVEVDETKWFKLFQKERWASYFNSDPKQLSVDIDNKEHWRKLSRVIEIANRILSEVLDQEWVASFLDTRARDICEPVSSGNGSQTWADTAIYRVAPLPPESRISKEQARKVLDDNAHYFFWGFHMPDEYPGVTGRTLQVPDKKRTTWHWMTLALTYMEPVFIESTPEDPEGRQAAVGMAKTFFKEERWAEAGYSLENAVFGTAMKNHWATSAGRLLYLGMCGMSPQTCETSLHFRYDSWSPVNPFLDTLLGIPAIFPCALTTSDFWNIHVRKYGCSSLRWSWVCEGKSKKINDETQMRPAKIMEIPFKYSRYDELNRSMKAVAEKLRKRRLDLKRLRPWYAEEYDVWCGTVYADTSLRNSLMSFVIALYGRSIMNEATAIDCVDQMVKPYNRLSDLEEVSPESKRPSKLFYQALGFLGQAALPVRTRPIPYEDDSFGEYLDRMRPALRPSFAGNADFADVLFQYGKASLENRKSKTLYKASSPSHDRELCMGNARLAFLRWKILGYVTVSLANDFELEWQWMRRQLDQAPLDDVVLEWTGLTWRYLRNYVGQPDHQSSSFFRPEQRPAHHSEGVDADIPAWAIARPVIASASTPARSAAARLPFYSIAEVGEHQKLKNPVIWGCLWNGKEMGVYDITEMLPNKTWDGALRNHITRPAPAPVCRMLRPDVIGDDCLRWLQDQGPVGYLVTPRRKEDIRINDGTLGKPRWVTFAEDVFDVTEINFKPELQDLETIITETTNGDPVVEAVNKGWHPDVIQEALRPYKIGWVWNKLGERHHRHHRVFTANEVNWHTTRETGIYTIIHDCVYDFTTFVDLHPGGSSIIEEVAGTDGTDLWAGYHSDPYSDFGLDVYKVLEGLQIGSIVQERDTKTVSPNEICIRDYIFSKDDFATSEIKENDRSLDHLAGYWGTDATAEMDKKVIPEVYRQLWERLDVITAKVVTPRDRLPYMSRKDLEGMNGKEKPGGFNESYVSDGKYVYNLTSYFPKPALLRYSRPNLLLESLKLKAGSVLSTNLPVEDGMKQWLWNTSQHRIIALYRTPKHTHITAEKTVAWRNSYRRTPSTKPKVAPEPGSSAVKANQASAPAPTPFTVRPLYPLRKKQKSQRDGPENPYPKLSQFEPSDAAGDFSAEMIQATAKTTLEQMGFAVGPEKRVSGQKRKMEDW
ncbi:putative cytochrome b5 [Colletotrichum spaethianum]|uniref:Cytochrome b5 n=1 Tax=Colletotrichum spaethianum TaxID=700344 RepID=A0AA37URI7_9PEZI|nr:putative cytochrome b5 [Colletotrichum spaethianum]GKT50852.1 putative cytochrome b5 [Colletotrichum spaethianum]